MIYESIQDLIGQTPLLKIKHFDLPRDVHLYAKLEFYNPGGSVKDRMAKYILEKAEEEGKLFPGSTIIEATAGNTGIGISLAALNKGYEVIFVVPEKFSIEKQQLMKALGATIIHTPKELGMKGAFQKVEELKQQMKNLFIPDQFNNRYNPLAHYDTTGRELYEDLKGKMTAFVSGAGSGGTFSGVMRYLKEKDHRIKGILADPLGSTLGGGNECHSYAIEGIGNDFIPRTMDQSLVDHVFKVSDQDAFLRVRELAQKEGLFVGSSSGAAFHVALGYAKTLKEGHVVVLMADRSDRYLSQDIYRFNDGL